MLPYLVVDVGGTKIAGNAVGEDGSLLYDDDLVRPSFAEGSVDDVCRTLATLLEHLNPDGQEVGCISLAFPGPFDYERGISLMRNVAKFDALYGLSVEDEMKQRTTLRWMQDARFFFLHDVEAYGWGVLKAHAHLSGKRVLCLCLGTGAGSAFIVDGRVVKEGVGVPPNGWVYDRPYRDSIIDDYLSGRGFARLSEKICGQPLDGREAQRRAERGDEKAKELFELFAGEIARAMHPFFVEFQPDVLVLGGNLSLGHGLFSNPLDLAATQYGFSILVETETSKRTFEGLVYAQTGGRGNG